MAQMFHQSLTGPALQWLLSLDISKRKTWEDLVASFVRQYDYNVQLKVTTRELESIKMRERESFTDFVKRWRAKAAQMTDRPCDKDQMRIITRNLQPDLAQYMITAQTHDFETYFEVGLSIEEGLQSGILKKGESTLKPKRVFTGNTNSFYTPQNYSNNTPSNPINNRPSKAEPVHAIMPAPPQNQRPRRVFTPLPLPLSAVFERLIQQGKLKPLTPTPPPQNPPPTWNPNQFCTFHQTPGHLTDRCQRLRHEIQDLIDNKQIRDPTEKPNTVTNPLPTHRRNAGLNHISFESLENNPSSTIFDPSQFITPETEPKPIVALPVEPEICTLSDQVGPAFWDKWGDMIINMESWEYEIMAANGQLNDEEWPQEEIELNQ